jgi:hypothetical protein
MRVWPMVGALLALLGATPAAGAENDPPEKPMIPIEGSAWRLSEPYEQPDADRFKLHVFRDRADCNGRIDPAQADACVPWINAAKREMHFAFRLIDPNLAGVPMALNEGRVALALGGKVGAIEVPADQFELVPHEAAGRGQLFVLLIDRSGSMYTGSKDRRPTMERVVQALVAPVTVDAFFPPEAGLRVGVMLLTFTDTVQGVDGEPLEEVEILRDPDEYRVAVDHLLDQPGSTGWTHLYDSVQTTLDRALSRTEVSQVVQLTKSEPVLVVLTDGFNNVAATDTCGTNEKGLGGVLESLRANQGGVGRRATTFTVGFGEPFRPEFRLPSTPPRFPTAANVCGDAVDTRIDGTLDARGIDNVSLAYMAEAGGGRTYAGTDSRALARFLADAGTRLYRWYEVRARLEEGEQQRFRTRIPLRLNVRFPRQVESRFVLFPNPYVDGPPGSPGAGGGFAGPGDLRQTTAELVLGLGATFALFVLAIGGYHLRRAVIRMARRTREALRRRAGA